MEGPSPKHLVLAGGGVRLLLLGVGAASAFERSGIPLATIGGASGGAIAAALVSIYQNNGNTIDQLIEALVEFDLDSLFPWRWWRNPDRLRPYYSAGMRSSVGLGEILNERSKGAWPGTFWTVAISGRDQILFDSRGVHKISHSSGFVEQLSETPIPIGDAVRASCNIPGIFGRMELLGQVVHDGSLSRDGVCPMPLAQRWMGAKPEDIIGIQLRREMSPATYAVFRGLARHPVRQNIFPYQTLGGALVVRSYAQFGTLEFKLDQDLKRLTIERGRQDTLNELQRAGWI